MIVYHLLDRDEPYRNLGGDYFIKRQSSQAYQRRLITPLERMATA